MEITKEDESPITIRKNEPLTNNRFHGKLTMPGETFTKRTKKANLLFIPKRLYMVKGSPYTLILSGRTNKPVNKANIMISFDPQKIEVISLEKANEKTFSSFDNSSGTINIGVELQGKQGFLNFGSIKFKPKTGGKSVINIQDFSLTDKNGEKIELSYSPEIKIIVR